MPTVCEAEKKTVCYLQGLGWGFSVFRLKRNARMSLLMSYIYSFFFFELLRIQSYIQSSHVMFYIAVKAAQNFKWYFMKFYQHPQILLSLNLCTTITVFVFLLFPYSYAQFYQTVLSIKLHKLLNLFTFIKLRTYSIIWDFIRVFAYVLHYLLPYFALFFQT